MKKTALGLIIGLCWQLAVAEHRIDYRISSLGNLVYQLDCLAKVSHFRCSRGDFNALWAEANMVDEADQVMLDRWLNLRTALDQNIELTPLPDLQMPTSPNFPINAKTGMNLLVKARLLAFRTGSPDTYQIAASQWLPINHVSREHAVIKHFWPRFQSWFKQQTPTLDSFVEEAKTISEEVDVNTLLSNMRSFYRSDLPESMVLPVYLVAHPKAQARTSGLVFDENSIIEVLKGESARERLGVVLHEIAHFYHERAPLEWHMAVMKRFTNPTSATGKTGYYLFNEAMASAIGNGIFEERSREPAYFEKYLAYPMSFYANTGIDQSAKTALPLVKDHIDNNKAMDLAFLKALDELWAKDLADIKDSPKQRFRHVGMVILSPEHNDLIDHVFGSIQPSSAQINTLDEDTDLSDLVIHRHPNLDTLILASNWEQLKPLNIPGLEQATQTAANRHIIQTENGAVWVLLVNDDVNVIKQAVDELLKQSQFEAI